MGPALQIDEGSLEKLEREERAAAARANVKLSEHMAADALSRFFSASSEAEFEAAAAAVPWPQDEDTAAEANPNQAAPPATDAPEGRDAGGVSELAAATGAMQLSPSGPPGGQARRHGAAHPAAHAAPLALPAPPSALRLSPHPRPPHCLSPNPRALCLVAA